MRYPSGTFSLVCVGDSQTIGVFGVNGDRPEVSSWLGPSLAITWDGYAYQPGGTPPSDKYEAIASTSSVFWQDYITSALWGPGHKRVGIWAFRLGANDLAQDLDLGFGASMAILFAAAKTIEPRSVVTVSRVIYPGFVAGGGQARLAAMNVQLAATVLAAQAAGQAIELEADPGIVTPTDIYQGDGLGVHFTASGYTKLARVRANGIVRALTRAGF